MRHCIDVNDRADNGIKCTLPATRTWQSAYRQQLCIARRDQQFLPGLCEEESPRAGRTDGKPSWL